MKRVIALLALAMGTTVAFAQMTPVGVWKTIDDDGKTEKSTVRISDAGGALSGRIETLTDASKREAVCDKCSDERKDKKLVGLTILRNVTKDADEESLWAGGDILDPNNGKVYKVRLRPVDGGKKLEVRGFVGMPMLGRTQTWVRVE
ncbi:DUF2147 domain-containing protein [Piscinibacter terrae]|uniref:DUF2147 domain-containing protein n=1 Tax=Piscinibacter terrae TaxID=2496871 RepID=A0A3N7HSG6_9BURK|nr:DUF2147 domain-containing protein [Albitalea terrae]RQP25144.1 DUF2147 domain-containing protein [Albitalea terrae]